MQTIMNEHKLRKLSKACSLLGGGGWGGALSHKIVNKEVFFFP